MAKNRRHLLHKFDSVAYRHHLRHQGQIRTNPLIITNGYSKGQMLDVSEFTSVDSGILTGRDNTVAVISHGLPDQSVPLHAPDLFITEPAEINAPATPSNLEN